jgi:hypothetical protein
MTYNICIWAASVECLTYTIARTAALNGCNVYVITKPKPPGAYSGHTRYYDKLEKLRCVQVLNHFEPIKLEWLYIQPIPGFPMSELLKCAAHAKHVGLFSSCGKPSLIRVMRKQIQEATAFLPIILKVEQSFFMDGFYPVDLYSFWMKRHLTGFDVHSNFLDDSVLFAKLFAFEWQPESIRKYRFNFIGNRKPQFRADIINSIKSYLTSQNLYPLSDDDLAAEIIWIEYGDEPGEQRGVPASDYSDILSESDFTISPPGYSKLTHRTMEALVRGSIPILHENELELYDINLQDQVNCLAVKNGDWSKAIEDAVNMPLDQIIQIRSNILAMKDEYLSDAACSKRLGAKMGLFKCLK